MADTNNNRIQMVPVTSGTYFGQVMTANYAYTIAGSPTAAQGLTGNGGPATSALLDLPYDATVDNSGNLYIADANNNRVQMVPPPRGLTSGETMTANYMYTVAGSPTGASWP